MIYKEKLKGAHYLYNLARYIFLRIENEYSNRVEPTGITLPQLRVLWIINSFPGISLGQIANIGCWTPPTVTKMLKILINKELVIKEDHDNKRLYRLQLTIKGEEYININKQYDKDFPLFKIYDAFSEEEIDQITYVLKDVSIHKDNEIVLTYIDTINSKGLKIDYSKTSNYNRKKVEKCVYFYNLLRILILSVECEHRKQLLSFNLTYPQLRALWLLEAFPGITSSQLSEIGFWAPSTANIIVKNLYNKELIYKEKAQLKNSLFLYISHKGEELILKDFRENQEGLPTIRKIEETELDRLYKINKLLTKMNQCLGNDKVEIYVDKTFQVISRRWLEA
ncbi:MAG: MarR family transcriptional regulator [Bacillota bacterium]|nr:MarR family transcriptional regulator [Bacillota bacterium]